MPSPLTIICPVGDKFGTVKSHALAGLGAYEFPTQEQEDEFVANYQGIYTEVTHEEWALFAINARSANVTGAVGSFGEHTLWRSSLPAWLAYTLDTEVGREASPSFFNTGRVTSKPKGILPFVTSPWVVVRYGINLPNPGEGYRTPFLSQQCYILDGKFYIGIRGIAPSLDRVGVSGQTLTYYRIVDGTEHPIVFEITSTFYPTS